MLKQINILRDPLGNGGGGGASTVIVQSNTGQSLSGTLSEGDGDNSNDNSPDGESGDDNIFDIESFKTNESSSTNPQDADNKDKDKKKSTTSATTKQEKEKLPPKDRLPKATKDVVKAVKEDDTEEVIDGEENVEEEEIVEEGIDKQQQVDNKDKRDYTGFAKEDIEYLKKLPNGVYNHVVPILKKLYAEQATSKANTEKLKKFETDPNRVPDSWYEHKDAYTLSPEFQKLTGMYNKVDTEASHWEQQLVNLRTHKAYVPILSFDSKTGEYKYGDPVKDLDDASIAKLEVQMQQLINKATVLKENYNNDAVKLQQSFAAQHGSINTYYDKADEMIKTLPEQFHPKDDHMNKFEATLHPAHKGTSIGKLAAKMYSIIINQGIALAELNKQRQTSLKNNLDNKAAGPKSKGSSSSSPSNKNKYGGNGDEEIDFNKLKQEMEG